MPRASLRLRILVTLLASSVVVSAAQEAFKFDAPGFRLSNAILSSEWHAYVEQLRQNNSIPGISVAVVQVLDDKEPQVQFASFGRKTEEGDGHDMTPDTLFGIASCSKAFLATSVGLLIDDYAHGRNVTPLPTGLKVFDWETKVKDILPKKLHWSLKPIDGDDSATRNAKIKDILVHVSGLPTHDLTFLPGDTPESVTRRMGKLRTAYELREQYSYNNQFYILGAYLVEHYANTTLAEFVSKRIFNPLGMSSSTYSPSAAAASGNLSQSWHDNGRRIPFWADDHTASFMAGAGGVITNVADMTKWLLAWLGEGVDTASKETIIPKDVYDEVTTAQAIVDGRPSVYYESLIGYGMGWERWAAGGVDLVYHTGGVPGFSSLVSYSPSHKLGVVALLNMGNAISILDILKKTLDDVLGTQLIQTATSVSESVRASTKQAAVQQPEPVKAVTPSLNLEAYTGAYTSDDGYLPVTLCTTQSKSAQCHNVISDFATVDDSTELATNLYGSFHTIWTSHLRLQHFSGDSFNFTFTALFPHGYGQNTSGFSGFELEGGWVEFQVDKKKGVVEGFSLVVDEDAYAARVRKLGGPLSKTADAWFRKV